VELDRRIRGNEGSEVKAVEALKKGDGGTSKKGRNARKKIGLIILGPIKKHFFIFLIQNKFD